ncbi:hypothetical protein ACNF40_06790 [Cuniculiplasma sp. SKW4]|uniref:hypothetical protein n=1 Tax=Cuniculiplasma sp. SKW4 TaxID=3400171 RepID=UPI003FD3EBFE
MWLFMEGIANSHRDKKIWKSILKLFQEKEIIQDASFIESSNEKRKKGDDTIPIDPRFPEKPARQKNLKFNYAFQTVHQDGTNV